MADVMAFGRWPAYRLSGNPYVGDVEKVYLTNPRIALMRNVADGYIGFVACKRKNSNEFLLPQGKTKATPIFYGVHSPIEEWVRNKNGYSPIPGSDAHRLTTSLAPEHVARLVKGEDDDPFTSFPLSYRQMLLHASRLSDLSVDDYLKTLSPEREEHARRYFMIDVPAYQ